MVVRIDTPEDEDPRLLVLDIANKVEVARLMAAALSHTMPDAFLSKVVEPLDQVVTELEHWFERQGLRSV